MWVKDSHPPPKEKKDIPKGPTPHSCNVPPYQFSLPLSHEETNALNPGIHIPSSYKLPDMPFPHTNLQRILDAEKPAEPPGAW